MSFLGKEYKYVKGENYAEFLKSLNIADDKIQQFLTDGLKEKIVKNGDTYTVFYSNPFGDKELNFRPGVEFEEPIEGDFSVKSVYKIEGDGIHQVSKSDEFVATFKREYKGEELVITMTNDKWNGVARTYYKA